MAQTSTTNGSVNVPGGSSSSSLAAAAHAQAATQSSTQNTHAHHANGGGAYPTYATGAYPNNLTPYGAYPGTHNNVTAYSPPANVLTPSYFNPQLSQQQHQQQHSPDSPTTAAPVPNAKRKPSSSGTTGGDEQPSEAAPAPKRRRQRASTTNVVPGPAADESAYQQDGASGYEVQEKEEPHEGGHGVSGSKHWTDDEKGKLFVWLLSNDDHWESFGSKMNTVFREASLQLFGGRKTFTALKSCYHRNVETFKQIYAFEAFLSKAANHPPDMPIDPTNIANMPIPAQFESAMQRQRFLERKLEAARTAGAPIANLSLKVVDNWHQKGWYALFKSRFREDPQTGLPVPFHGPFSDPNCPILPFPGPSSTGTHLYSQTAVDPRLAEAERQEEEEEEEEEDGEHEQDDNAPRTQAAAGGQVPRQRGLPTSIIPPPFPAPPGVPTPVRTRAPRQSTSQSQQSPAQAQAQAMPRYSPAAQSPYATMAGPSQMGGYPYPPPAFYPPASHDPYQAQQQHFQAQTAHTLAHIAGLAQNIMAACTTLTDLLRVQVEESKARWEMVRKREEREEAMAGEVNGVSNENMDAKQKAKLATEVLAAPGVEDEVKQAAREYLKRLFMAES